MKIDAPVKINISDMKADIDPNVKIEDIKADLKNNGANVAGYRDDDGTVIMVISGDIDLEDIEDIFKEDADVDIDDYTIDDIDYADDEPVDVFENKHKKVNLKKALSEKKGGCCPPKKKGSLISLSEALHGKRMPNKKVTLNNVIDNMVGNSISESVASKAMKKAKSEAKKAYLVEKLGYKKYNAIVESLKKGKTSIYENVKINGKRIAEYSTKELVNLLEKVNLQIAGLKKKIGKGLNETETDKLNKALATKNKIRTILDEEISFRKALKSIKEDDDAKEVPLDFKDLNPNSDSDDKEKDNDKDNDAADSDDADKSDDENDSKDDENPDDDEEVEIGSIIITLNSKSAAQEMKQDFVDAGIPEDVIEIEPVTDEDSDEENSDEDEEKSDEEEKNESWKERFAKEINEDDDSDDKEDDSDTEDAETKDDDDDNSDEDSDDDESDDDNTEYKLILTDTDYAPTLSKVLQDDWGMTKDEFDDMIGGEIVPSDSDDDTDNDSDDKDDESSDDDSDEDSDSKDDDDTDDFDPDDVFKDL